MKILLVSTYDSDGGAAKASHRILNGLIKIGISACMLVRTKRTDDANVFKLNGKFRAFLDFFMPFLDHLPLKWYRNSNVHFWNTGWINNPGFLKKVSEINPDIVQLHWISEGFVPLKLIGQLNYPIVWRLSDSYAFTGGCHVPFECINYRTGCGNCPQLNSRSQKDLSSYTLKKKSRLWREANITIVTPSNWMADCVRNSTLFARRPVRVIFPGIDTTIFRPREKSRIKQELNLDPDKRYIIFGAIKATKDPNKGFDLLKEALLLLKEKTDGNEHVEIIILGASEPENPIDLGFKCNYIGRIHDEVTLSLYYSIGEVFVLPSLKDNSPNTVIESLGCGVPVVAFAACGALDMVDHKLNGYLADAYSVEDLSDGLDWVLNRISGLQYLKLCENARAKVFAKFNIDNITMQYKALYDEIL